MDHIRGKTVAITGAARGIGYATAEALLARGARVVIGDREVAMQELAVVKLSALGQVSGYPLDVTDRESFTSFLDKARTDGNGHSAIMPTLAPKARPWLSHKTGNDTVFLDFDRAARDGYERRAQAALGVVDSQGGPD
ncbi:MAG TPA: SDR family NAD(P)-dependent oxidoreductase [Mycobacterium sp.]|nr:SDR family NAD(P)-dependent oxidoreductase [Mycobacterium sp.]